MLPISRFFSTLPLRQSADNSQCQIASCRHPFPVTLPFAARDASVGGFSHVVVVAFHWIQRYHAFVYVLFGIVQRHLGCRSVAFVICMYAYLHAVAAVARQLKRLPKNGWTVRMFLLWKTLEDELWFLSPMSGHLGYLSPELRLDLEMFLSSLRELCCWTSFPSPST